MLVRPVLGLRGFSGVMLRILPPLSMSVDTWAA